MRHARRYAMALRALGAATTRPGDSRGVLPFLLLGAVLSVAGHLPLWGLVVWFVGLRAVRTSEKARLASAAVPVLLAFTVALPALPDVPAFLTSFVRLLAVGYALHLALTPLEEGRPAGLLWLAAVWVAAPSPLGLFGLLVTATAHGVLGQRGTNLAHHAGALAALVVTALAVALASAWLPPPRAAWSFTSPPAAVQTAPQARQAVPAPAPAPAASRPGSAPAHEQQPPPASRLPALELVFTVMLIAAATLLLSLFTARAVRRRRERRAHWSDLLVPAAILVSLVVFGLFQAVRPDGAATLRPEASSGALAGPVLAEPAETGPAGAAAGSSEQPVLLAAAWFAAAVLLLAALALILGRRTRDRAARARAEVPPGEATGRPAPSDRVRAAYRRFLAVLREVGEGRRGDETPRELQRRLTERYPQLAADVAVLTGLYQPVRYGQAAPERDAEQAEFVAERLAGQLRPTPPLEKR